MPRIDPIDPLAAEGKARELLDGVRKSLGVTPNIMATLARAPAALESYLGFAKTLGRGNLTPALREQIALAVAGANGCDYCASAHTAIGGSLGLDESELRANLEARSDDPRVAAALRFARTIVTRRGHVSDDDVNSFRAAGYDDGDIVEVVAAVALNLFSNYFNHVADTAIDFPLVETKTAVTT